MESLIIIAVILSVTLPLIIGLVLFNKFKAMFTKVELENLNLKNELRVIKLEVDSELRRFGTEVQNKIERLELSLNQRINDVADENAKTFKSMTMLPTHADLKEVQDEVKTNNKDNGTTFKAISALVDKLPTHEDLTTLSEAVTGKFLESNARIVELQQAVQGNVRTNTSGIRTGYFGAK